MKLVFFGTPDFAVPSLKALNDSTHDVVGVVTNPDTRSGRGLKIKSSSIKICAQKLKIPILQPDNLTDNNFISSLKQIKPDDAYINVGGKLITFDAR